MEEEAKKTQTSGPQEDKERQSLDEERQRKETHAAEIATLQAMNTSLDATNIQLNALAKEYRLKLVECEAKQPMVSGHVTFADL